MSQRVGGIVAVRRNGSVEQAKGNFTYNLGKPKREAVIGSDSVHGYKEVPQVAFIEGEITDRSGLDLKALVTGEDLTVTLDLANGKVISMTEAWFAAEGTGNTEEGNIPVRWESKREAEEIS